MGIDIPSGPPNPRVAPLTGDDLRSFRRQVAVVILESAVFVAALFLLIEGVPW